MHYLWPQLPRQYALSKQRKQLHTIDAIPETTLSYASVMGIKRDINLNGDDYQWLSSMFYFGQFDAQRPQLRYIFNAEIHPC